jgi:SPP1 family predicted phage head-tail adaptor
MNSRELSEMRAEQEKQMPEVVYIQRLTRTPDGAGGWTETWQTLETTNGRIAPSQRGAGEEVRGGAVKVYGEFIVTLPHDTELRQDDRLQINGTQYEVKAIFERSEKTVLRVLVSKV